MAQEVFTFDQASIRKIEDIVLRVMAMNPTRKGPIWRYPRQGGGAAGEPGPPGPSGVYLANLNAPIDPGSATNVEMGTGVIYSVSAPASVILTSFLGSKAIGNPFPSTLPTAAGNATAVYPCHLVGTDPDVYLIASPDPMRLLASYSGFGQEKLLFMPTAETDVENIIWDGVECQQPGA